MTYEEKLLELASRNENLVILTAENRAAIRNIPEQLGPRFLDVGIAEQTMIGAAAGLALRGRIPIVHALATFLTMRAFEFIRTDVGIPALPVKLIGAVPGFLSEANGPTHQALEDIALMRGIPFMRVFCPADRQELVDALDEIVEAPFPCYVRYNGLEAASDHPTPFGWGCAEVLTDGFDVTILTYGFLLREAIVAGEILEKKGISVRLINVRTLAPVDTRTILRAARETSLVVTFEDHFLTGGLFTIVSEVLLRNGVSCSCLPVALDHRWFKPSLLDRVLEYEGFTGKKLADQIETRLGIKTGTTQRSLRPRFDLSVFSSLR